MCCNSSTYTANTGTVNINTANSNLNGTGAMGTVLTADVTKDGTQISSVTIKATGNTSQGMVRLFVDDTVNVRLLLEVPIPATVQTGVVASFGVSMGMSLQLAPGCSLKASTEVGDSFNVTAVGKDWKNCAC